MSDWSDEDSDHALSPHLQGCFNCGEIGHQLKDCPNPKIDKSGRSGCYNCGETDHQRSNCPNPKMGEDQPKECFSCKEKGHISRDCPIVLKNQAERNPPLGSHIPVEIGQSCSIFEDRKNAYKGKEINSENFQSTQWKVTGDNAVEPVNAFVGMGLNRLILENVSKCGYGQPTPVQKHGTPQIMNGQNIMCCAQTGSGKTAAYLLPIISNLLEPKYVPCPPMTTLASPEALILAPTRELAIQIWKEANMYSYSSYLKTQVVYGGTEIYAQKQQLMNGCDVLVATTGRLKQFLLEKVVNLSKVKYFILDEADRMLELGFMPDVEAIVEQLPPSRERVSGMFSATFASDIETAAKTFLGNYIYIVIGVVGGASTDVTQEILYVEKAEKRIKLVEILDQLSKDEKVIVFVASKTGADFLASFLSLRNHSCTSIHGNRFQIQRETALSEFTTGKRQVLVATSVASRGLDIPNVALVINFDLPREISDYVHRIGRTGRLGQKGKAVSFYNDTQDSNLRSELISVLEGAGQTVPAFLKLSRYEESAFSSAHTRKSSSPVVGNSDDDDW